MLSLQSIDRLDAHEALWTRIQPMMSGTRLAHAFLLIGPRHARILQFANRLMALLLCKQTTPPCGVCQACHLLLQGTHPDIHYLRPDTPGGPLKIDQIRALQQDVYQTPQCGTRRFIVIEPADKLNTAAANALLKVLEEPPEHTTFLLIAEQIQSLPATIISRCQHYIFPAPLPVNTTNSWDYVTLGAWYADGTARAELFSQRASLIDSFCAFVEGKTTACALATLWSVYALEDLLWFLYLITAQAIQYQLRGPGDAGVQEENLTRVFVSQQPTRLFKQLDKINSFSRTMQKSIAVNQTLALETLLLGYL